MTGNTNRAEAGGSAEDGQEVGRREWRCPHCDHALSYAPRDRDAAELAANSHMSRRHPQTKGVVLLPDPGDHAGRQ